MNYERLKSDLRDFFMNARRVPLAQMKVNLGAYGSVVDYLFTKYEPMVEMFGETDWIPRKGVGLPFNPTFAYRLNLCAAASDGALSTGPSETVCRPFPLDSEGFAGVLFKQPSPQDIFYSVPVFLTKTGFYQVPYDDEGNMCLLSAIVVKHDFVHIEFVKDGRVTSQTVLDMSYGRPDRVVFRKKEKTA